MRAKSCNFGQLENLMIRDKIVFSTTGKMQQLLLDDKLDLCKAIKICQSYKQANKQVQEMNEDKDKQVHKVNTKQQKKQPPRKPVFKQYNKGGKTSQAHVQIPKLCKFCGRKQFMKKEECPAWSQRCTNCNGKNHLSPNAKSERP